jgi:hypothetical protein
MKLEVRCKFATQIEVSKDVKKLQKDQAKIRRILRHKISEMFSGGDVYDIEFASDSGSSVHAISWDWKKEKVPDGLELLEARVKRYGYGHEILAMMRRLAQFGFKIDLILDDPIIDCLVTAESRNTQVSCDFHEFSGFTIKRRQRDGDVSQISFDKGLRVLQDLKLTEKKRDWSDEELMELCFDKNGTDLRYAGGIALLYARMACIVSGARMTERNVSRFYDKSHKFVTKTEEWHEKNRVDFRPHRDWRAILLPEGTVRVVFSESDLDPDHCTQHYKDFPSRKVADKVIADWLSGGRRYKARIVVGEEP